MNPEMERVAEEILSDAERAAFAVAEMFVRDESGEEALKEILISAVEKLYASGQIDLEGMSLYFARLDVPPQRAYGFVRVVS